jgi:hypothetical protein
MLQYRVQWTDSRLMTMPCRGALSELLEVRQASTTEDKKSQESNKQLLWLPTPSVQDQTKQEVKEANIIVGERLPWLDPASVPAEYAHHDACPKCGVYMEKSLVTWEIGSEAFGDYRRYPFDEHQINLTLSVADGDLYSCETALRNKEWRLDTLPSRADDALWNELLLPPTNEWTIKPESSTVRMQHGEDGSVCLLHLTIKRNYAIFVRRQPRSAPAGPLPARPIPAECLRGGSVHKASPRHHPHHMRRNARVEDGPAGPHRRQDRQYPAGGANLCCSWVKVLSALFDDSAPSAHQVAPTAQTAPTAPHLQQLGSSPRPQEPDAARTQD